MADEKMIDFEEYLTRDYTQLFNQAKASDVDTIEQGVRMVLEGLGFGSLLRDGLSQTPIRVANMLLGLTQPERFTITTFAVDDDPEHGVKYDEMILVTKIQFYSMCEHHMLPFFGTVDVGYLPGKKVVGLSKIARAIDYFAQRLQMQERLTQQIAMWIMGTLNPEGVGVIVRARHLCMEMRGVQKPSNETVTSAMLGAFRESQTVRQEFLSLVKRGE